jgi:hypothetical protein
MTRTLTDSGCINLHSVSGGESANVLVKQQQKIEKAPPEFLSKNKFSPQYSACIRILSNLSTNAASETNAMPTYLNMVCFAVTSPYTTCQEGIVWRQRLFRFA